MISNKKFSQQKAALTRAIRSDDPMKVQTAVQKAVREWEEAGGQWPDDWSRWQRAMDDAFGLHKTVDIETFR